MSNAAVDHVYRYSPYIGATFVVHLAIADVANDINSHRFWMLEVQLAKKARVSRRSVSAAMARFVADGWLVRLDNAVKMGHPAEFAFQFKEAPLVFETRSVTHATSARVPGVTHATGADTHATSALDARNQCVHNPSEPKRTQSDASALAAFDAFWAQYPRKTAKGAARTAYLRALKKTTPEEIDRGLVRAMPGLRSNPKFTPHPATWLNQERWSDVEVKVQTSMDWAENLLGQMA